MTELQQKMQAAYDADPTISKKRMRKATGCGMGTAQRFLEKLRGKKPAPPPDAPEDVSVDYSSDKASICTKSTKITNLDEALAAAKVDLAKWEVERHVVNWWDTTFKAGDAAKTVRNFQIKVWLKPKTCNHVLDALRGLTAELKGPVVPYFTRPKAPDPHMLEISIFDLHFGKLAWGEETGTDYDLKIAESLFNNAIRSLLVNVDTFQVDTILLPIGSDFFHINCQANTTANNTPQDVDTRLAKIYQTACKMVVNAIDTCAAVAPVEVLFVPGNHDRETAFYLCSYLEAWYHQHQGVKVDVSPKARKYKQYGATLLGFTHGHGEKVASLPLIMAGEVSNLWAQSTHREWHIGHLHQKKEMQFLSGDTHGPVFVRMLPSLSGTDAWHYSKGFVGAQRAAEAYLYSHRNGYTGHFSANVAA